MIQYIIPLFLIFVFCFASIAMMTLIIGDFTSLSSTVKYIINSVIILIGLILSLFIAYKGKFKRYKYLGLSFVMLFIASAIVTLYFANK
jgi:hypothetical protein